MRKLLFMTLWLVFASAAMAGNGPRLWLRLGQPASPSPATVAVVGDSALTPSDAALLRQAEAELRSYWQGNPVMLQLGGPAGAFSVEKSPQGSIRVCSASAVGLLYGVYFILRSQVMGDGCLCATLASENPLVLQSSAPLRPLRLADRVEDLARRGLLTPLARANASIGVNALVLSRQHRNDKRLRAAADTLARYGISLLQPADERLAGMEVPVVSLLSGRLLPLFEWYVAGRRAWDPTLTSSQLAFEWLAQTFSENPLFVLPLRDQLASPSASPDDLERQLQEAAACY